MYVSYRADAFVSKGDPPERLLAAVDACWHKQHCCTTGSTVAPQAALLRHRRYCCAAGCQPMVSLTSARFRARGSKL
jgi:hypothetical protein